MLFCTAQPREPSITTGTKQSVCNFGGGGSSEVGCATKIPKTRFLELFPREPQLQNAADPKILEGSDVGRVTTLLLIVIHFLETFELQ